MKKILPKLTLSFNKEKKGWDLKIDKTKKVLKSFNSKSRAVKSGVLKKILGEIGGSVKIKKINSKIQEERTYPKSKDPKKSIG